MKRDSAGLTIKVPYSSGWVIVSTDSGEIKAHAKNFADIVAKGDKLPGTNYAILSASKSYHGHVMITLVGK